MKTAALPFPQAVIFDWDNALVDTWPLITDALNATREAYGLKTWSVSEARVKSARPLRETFPQWFGKSWEKARTLFYDRFYDRFASFHGEKPRAVNGAKDMLSWLYNQGIPLFVVSNKKSAYLKAEIDYLGWSGFFTQMIGAGEAKHDKPAPDPVRIALKENGISADNPAVWFVGDTPSDVECALRSGCTPIILHDKGVSEQFGIKGFFSDCHTMKITLYNWSKSKPLDSATEKDDCCTAANASCEETKRYAVL